MVRKLMVGRLLLMKLNRGKVNFYDILVCRRLCMKFTSCHRRFFISVKEDICRNLPNFSTGRQVM